MVVLFTISELLFTAFAILVLHCLLPQEYRESKKRLEELVDELKKELSTAEHQLQKNNMEIKVLQPIHK